jgi:hypothetical protein
VKSWLTNSHPRVEFPNYSGSGYIFGFGMYAVTCGEILVSVDIGRWLFIPHSFCFVSWRGWFTFLVKMRAVFAEGFSSYHPSLHARSETAPLHNTWSSFSTSFPIQPSHPSSFNILTSPSLCNFIHMLKFTLRSLFISSYYVIVGLIGHHQVHKVVDENCWFVVALLCFAFYD